MSSGSDGQNAAVVEMAASAPQQVFSRKYERTALQVVAIGLVCESDMVTSESAMTAVMNRKGYESDAKPTRARWCPRLSVVQASVLLVGQKGQCVMIFA